MSIQLTAFRWVPPFAQGYVKDLRVRWALEEAGLAYEVELVDAARLNSDAYLQWQPFGQVPAFKDADVTLFESGAIVMHLAGRSPRLAPADATGRARVAAWVFAALNSIEPHANNLIDIDDAPPDAAWAKDRRPEIQSRLERRLASLSHWLDGKAYLEGDFTAGDLVMSSVLRELVDSGILSHYPILDDYRRRCLERPAFDRALNAQLETFRQNAPA